MEENNVNQTQEPQVNQGYQQTQPKKTNSLGLASFICAIVGLFVAGLPLGIAAIITGIMGCTKFNPETETNKWMAIAGIVLGAIDAILVIYFLIFASTVATGFINSLN